MNHDVNGAKRALLLGAREAARSLKASGEPAWRVEHDLGVGEVDSALESILGLLARQDELCNLLPDEDLTFLDSARDRLEAAGYHTPPREAPYRS